MNIFAFSGFLLGFTCLFLGTLILRYGTNKLHLTFALQNLSICIWGFGCGFAGISELPEQAFFWWKLANIGAYFVITFLLHHSLLLNKMKQMPLLIASYALATSLPVVFYLNLSGVKMRYVFDSFYIPQPINMVYPTYCIFWLITAVYITFLIIKAYKESPERERIPLTLYSFAYLVGLWGGGSFIFLIFGMNLYPYGNFMIPLYCIIMTYTILRHQLLDIQVIIKKTLVFAGLLASVFVMLILPTLVIQEYIFRGAGTGGKVIGLTISGIIIMLALRRIENFLINVTDKFLFQKKYSYKELLKTFTSEVLTVLDIDVLVHTTVDRLSHIMKIQSCGLLLLNKTKNQYELVASVGVDKNWRNITLGLDNTLASFLAKTKSYLSTRHQGKDSALPKHIIEDMNKLKLELAIPLNIHDDMIGILTLGKKKSDEDYIQDDMDILLPLARTLAIALSNANMLVELGKTQAEAAQREKMAVIGTLSAGINHEICNPLGIARGQCEAFLLNVRDGLYKNKKQEELVEKAQNIMEKVIHETDRATAITKRLSSFAKPSKGLLSEDININDEMDEVLALVGYELKLDKVEIEKDINKELPTITGDKKQLQEVFFNLIRNAAQAIEERGRIVIRAKQHDGKILVEIEDTGHGIPEDKIDQIFNPFFTTKEPGKGTGLGLFIVRQVVERNKGRISVKSKVGEGTTFMLEFPAAAKARVT